MKEMVDTGKRIRQYGNDAEVQIVQTDFAADDGRVGTELAFPYGMGKRHNRIAADNLILFGPEATPEGRLDSQSLEEISAHHVSGLELRLRVSVLGEADRNESVGDEAFKGPALVTKIDVIRVRDVSEIPGGRRGAKADDSRRVRNRQRPEQKAIGHTEDCRVRADGQRDGDDGSRRTASILP